MPTPNLAIPHIASNQNQKEVTANSAFDSLDLAITGLLTATVADADYTLSATDALQNAVFVFTGALTADRNVIVPGSKKPYIVSNQTTGGFNLIVKTQSGTGVTVKPVASAYVLLYCNGANVVSELNADGVFPVEHLPRHTHDIADVTGLQTALDGKQPTPVAVPASATANGTPGQWAYDNGYLYLCVATNAWVRAALASW